MECRRRRLRCDVLAWQRWLGCLVAAAVLTIAVRAAHADAREDDAVASRLFNEGRRLVQDGRWQEACPKFEDSQRRDPALGTSLNLAQCYEKTGKLARAWQLYREAVDLAQRAGNFVRRDFAEARVEALELRLAQVVIAWSGKPRPEPIVSWDGQLLDGTGQRTMLHVDTGSHRLIASAPGRKPFVKRVTLTAGESRTIEIPDLVASGSPNDVTDRASALASAAIGSHVTRDRITLALGATSLVTTAGGLGFGVRASVEYDYAKALCAARTSCPPADRDRRSALLRDARSDAMASTVMVAAGGATALASVILFVTRPSTRASATARIVPLASGGATGLALSGPF